VANASFTALASAAALVPSSHAAAAPHRVAHLAPAPAMLPPAMGWAAPWLSPPLLVPLAPPPPPTVLRPRPLEPAPTAVPVMMPMTSHPLATSGLARYPVAEVAHTSMAPVAHTGLVRLAAVSDRPSCVRAASLPASCLAGPAWPNFAAASAASGVAVSMTGGLAAGSCGGLPIPAAWRPHETSSVAVHPGADSATTSHPGADTTALRQRDHAVAAALPATFIEELD
jgi:hypothetical protein